MDTRGKSGIDENQLNFYIREITNNMEQLERRFNQLDSVAESTRSFYQSDSGNKFRNSYRNLRYNFSIIRKNILSYKNDLSKVKASYRKFDSNAADTMLAYAREK